MSEPNETNEMDNDINISINTDSASYSVLIPVPDPPKPILYPSYPFTIARYNYHSLFMNDTFYRLGIKYPSAAKYYFLQNKTL